MRNRQVNPPSDYDTEDELDGSDNRSGRDNDDGIYADAHEAGDDSDEEEPEEEESEEDVNCASADTPSAELLELLFLLCIGFMTEEFIDGQPSSNLLVYYSGVLGFGRDGETFKNAKFPSCSTFND